ncbi:MAG: phage portal protein, partial [Nocardioides sp.]|uniref:phage portal protein n=1 Tax=Nocardioides sp. TaxID=35761 RepID=UPI00238EE9ED
RGVLTGRPDPVFSEALVGPAPELGDQLGDVPPEIFGFSSYAADGSPEPRVSRRLARQVPAVKRSRDLICGSLGGLPVVTVGPDMVVDRSSWLTQPERDVAPSVTMTKTVEDMFYEGVAWWLIVESTWNDYPMKVVRLEAGTVNVLPDHRVHNAGGQYRGTALEWPDSKQLIRFDSPNDPLLEAGARAIRQYLRLARAAGRNADGVPPSDYFTPHDNIDPFTDQTQVDKMLADWKRARQEGGTAYIPGAVDYHTGGWDPDKLQMAEQLQHAVLEIANTTGVDPEKLGVSTTSRTYFNAFEVRKDLLDFTLGAYRLAVQGRLSMGDVTPRSTRVLLDVDEFTRTDRKERYEADEIGLRIGAITKDEIRDADGRPPLDDSTTPPTEENDTVTTLPTPVAASAHADVIALTFADKPALTFDAPPSSTFEVDQAARVIRGLAVPYGVEGTSQGQRFSFGKGTLKFADVKRVKLWVQHDPNRAVGVATKLEDREDGLHAEFSVARGEEGDRVLALAEDGVLDGLSIGLGVGGRFTARDGVQHAVDVPLREISLTPAPSFDGARTYSAAGGGAPAAGAGGPGDQNIGTEIRKAMMQGFADMPAREFVSATRPLEVNEAAPYRFDGARGEHEFSVDVIAAVKGDWEAKQRVETFMAEEIDPATFAISSADVADLNPATNRPDLYVDRLVQVTPLWQALRKGSLTDATPFLFPKYASSADMVADHVTMVEPDPASFVATKQTVTPGALSGKAEIPREIFDAGGNPQVSRLIWREMERAYYEQIESKISAHLASLNPTAIELTAGAEDAVLVDELEAAYAGLQFIVGGFRFDYQADHVSLYKRLAAASDTTGRKLLPRIGATNSNGTSSARFAALDVAGVTNLPGPTLAGTEADGVRKSYLLASEDVHAWASPPRELRFEYQVAHIDIGIWGYHAEATSRLEGVRVINYNRAGA